MPVQLYFPDGVPEGYRRIVDPDEITQVLVKGLVALHSNLKNLSAKAQDDVHNISWVRRIFGAPLPDSEWLHTLLFKPELWPSLSKSDVTALNYLKRLMQLDGSNHRPVFPRGEPTKKEIKAGLEYLVKSSGRLFNVAYREYRDTLDRAAGPIRLLCEGGGEECTLKEAVAIANADLYSMWEIGRFPGVSPQMSNYLTAFLEHLES